MLCESYNDDLVLRALEADTIMNNHSAVHRRTWLILHLVGWICGIVISVSVGDSIEYYFPQHMGQSSLGLGMSLGISLMQWMYLRRHTTISLMWALGFIACFGLIFATADLLMIKLALSPSLVVPFAALISACCGSYLQVRTLGVEAGERKRWALQNLLGWGSATAVTFLGTSFQLRDAGVPLLLTTIIAFASVLVGGPLIALLNYRALLPIVDATSREATIKSTTLR